MTGPKRELPVLLVRITADPSAVLKGFKQVADEAKAMGKSIQDSFKATEKAQKESLKRQAANAKREVQNFLNLGSGQGKGFGKLTGLGKAVISQARKNQSAIKKAASMDMDALVKRGMEGTKRLKMAAVKEAGIQSKANIERARLVEQSRKAIQKQTSVLNNEEERATRRARIRKRDRLRKEKADAEKAAKDQAAALTKANKWLAQQVKSGAIIQQRQAVTDHNEARQQSRRFWQRRKGYILAIRQTRAEQAAERAALAADEHSQRRRARLRQISRLKDMRSQGQAARKQLGSLFGGGVGANMMGARADMFMHSGSIQNMAQSAVGFLTPFAQVENATIQMRAYAGSAEAAKEVIEEMQRFAIQSPYKLEGVLEAASNLMKYGQSAKEAMEITRMLGDVAGGNTAKLELLALATAQASGFGRLQGQELRQLVNAGFNPLKTAAQELAGGKGVATDEEIEKQMDFLLTAMRKRQLDSDIIKAALQVETSKGGDFAGITNEQARSLTGWANQFLETLDLIKIQITETFVVELKKGLETVVRYTEATVGWMKDNKELVKQYTMLGLKLLKYALAFSVVGFALASLKWVMGSMMMMLEPLKFMFKVLSVSIELFGNKAVLAWLKATAPLLGFVAGLLLLAFVLRGLTHKEGFTGMIWGWVQGFGYLIGFMLNFKQNFLAISTFIGKNFSLIIMELFLTPVRALIGLLLMIPRIAAYAFGYKLPDWINNAEANVTKVVNNIATAGKQGTYDTSMFKFDAPSIGDSKLAKDMQESVQKALAPYLPKDIEEMIKDKPNINFKDFIKGAEGGSGEMREHTSLGSAEHALRMYQFGQQAMARFDSEKKSSEKKQEELLVKIEKNTRQKAIGSGKMTVQDANLVLSAPGRID